MSGRSFARPGGEHARWKGRVRTAVLAARAPNESDRGWTEPTMTNQRPGAETATEHESTVHCEGSTDVRFHGVRYQVRDVARSAAFYSKHLGFRIERQRLPAFATLVLGPLDLLLSGPAASGGTAG